MTKKRRITLTQWQRSAKRVLKPKRRTKSCSGDEIIRQLQDRVTEIDMQVRLKDGLIGNYQERIDTLEIANTELRNKLPKLFTWVSRNGERQEPRDMEEGHLRNTISYLARTLGYNLHTYPWLSKVSDNALALHEMLKEAKRRGIEV